MDVFYEDWPVTSAYFFRCARTSESLLYCDAGPVPAGKSNNMKVVTDKYVYVALVNFSLFSFDNNHVHSER